MRDEHKSKPPLHRMEMAAHHFALITEKVKTRPEGRYYLVFDVSSDGNWEFDILPVPARLSSRSQ